MLSGRRLDLADPSPLDIEVEDIAHGLARVARWNGQTHGDHSYSVAQHSLLVLAIFEALYPKASIEQRLFALMHDGAEYVVGDLISPFKALVGRSYKGLEERLLSAVMLSVGLSGDLRKHPQAKVKRADRIAAYFEATELAGFAPEEARRFFGQPEIACPQPLTPVPATEVKQRFLDCYQAMASEFAATNAAPLKSKAR
jgi:5'-deoxynucleotidase YfbR-like HD superfamily hydrolase